MNAIRDKIRAGYPGLYLLTHEETSRRSHAQGRDQHDAALACTHPSGPPRHRDQPARRGRARSARRARRRACPKKTVLLLRDFGGFLAKTESAARPQAPEDALLHAKTANKCLILLGGTLHLQADIETHLRGRFACLWREESAGRCSTGCGNRSVDRLVPKANAEPRRRSRRFGIALQRQRDPPRRHPEQPDEGRSRGRARPFAHRKPARLSPRPSIAEEKAARGEEERPARDHRVERAAQGSSAAGLF